MTEEHTYDPRSHYDRVTEAWKYLLGEDLHYGVFATGDESLPEATAELTNRMVQGARLEPGLEVLDVGCGTGSPACHLAQMGVSVLGITPSEVGVAAATARAAALGLSDRARFEPRDGMDNGLPDASFDRTWVLESSHLMRDRAAAMNECARVLRPGGRLTLCDIILRREMPFLEVRRLLKPLGVLRRVFGDARMEELSTYARLLEEAGMVVDEATDLTAATRPTFDRWEENARIHRDAVVALIGEASTDDFVESCAVLRGFWDDGTLGYGLITADKR